MSAHLGGITARAPQRTGTQFERWQACLAAIATFFGGMAAVPTPSEQGSRYRDCLRARADL